MATVTLSADVAMPLVQDYCQGETFEATCGRNEIVEVTEAMYGRMNIGRCITRDFGYLGCGVDVTDALQQECSGLQTCSVPLPSQFLEELNNCLDELSSYLSVAYRCVEIEGV